MLKIEVLLLLTSVGLNSTGSLLIKKGADAIIEQEPVRSIAGLFNHMLPAVNIFTFAGLACLGLSFVVFILLISRVQLSIAQPMLAMAYIIIMIGAHFIYGEPITGTKIAGSFVIIFGVYLLSSGVWISLLPEERDLLVQT